MKWEPVDNAEKVLRSFDVVLCWAKIDNIGFPVFGVYMPSRKIEVITAEGDLSGDITHFKKIEKPNDENTNQAS